MCEQFIFISFFSLLKECGKSPFTFFLTLPVFMGLEPMCRTSLINKVKEQGDNKKNSILIFNRRLFLISQIVKLI